MQKHLLLCTLLLWLGSLWPGFTQRINEWQLPEPDKLAAAGLIGGAGDVGAIYYGAVPPNSAGRPVLVFIHGYTSNARVWWEGNDMYALAYNNGYRTAFVSVHPDRSMWANGQMFAGMLNTIANHYRVSRVVVVAHSKGGIDSDAALIHYGAHNRVERVITLGTPHFGTPLANLAQSGWVSWLSAVFGQRNEATYVLQTGYMDYFRSLTDPHPNRPLTHFRTFGTWGYSGVLTVSGWYLNLNGGSRSNGGNDGVVNYTSTRRPNSSVIFGHLDSRGNLNHFEVAQGSRMWNYVRAQLPASLSRELSAELFQEAYNPNAVVVSRMQVVAAESGKATLTVEPGARSLDLYVFSDSPADIWLLNPFTQERTRMAAAENLRGSMLGDEAYHHRLEQPQPGVYQIESDRRLLVLAGTDGGSQLRFTSDLNEHKLTYTRGEPMHFRLQLSGYVPADATVSGTLVYTGDLVGNPQPAGVARVLRFRHEGNGLFSAQVNEDLPAGVYAINLEVKGQFLHKTLIHSIAVREQSEQGTNQLLPESLLQAVVYPNPSADGHFHIELPVHGRLVQLRVYDVAGRLISSWHTTEKNTTWQAPLALQNGLYLLEVEYDNQRQTVRMLLNR